MRRFTLPILVGSLLVLCAVAALAQSDAPPDKPVASPTVTASPAVTEHDSYLQKTRDEVALWRGKLDAFGAEAKGTAETAGGVADRDLHAAWAELQTASAWLQTVGADGWTSAKATYEKASDDLTAAWHKVHPKQT